MPFLTVFTLTTHVNDHLLISTPLLKLGFIPNVKMQCFCYDYCQDFHKYEMQYYIVLFVLFCKFFKSASIYQSHFTQSEPNTKFQISGSIPSLYTKFSTIKGFSNFLVHIFKTTFKSQHYTLRVTPISTFQIYSSIRSPKSNCSTKFSTLFTLCTHFKNHLVISTLFPNIILIAKCLHFSFILSHTVLLVHF